MNFDEIKKILDKAYKIYNNINFIETDPIQVPHSFSLKENIEIAAFFSSIFAWGKRSIIIRKSFELMSLMDFNPYDFIKNFSNKDIKIFQNFKHRTFNANDLLFFIKSLQNLYLNYGGLENVFNEGFKTDNTIKSALIHFRNLFFALPHQKRTEKHISNVAKKSAAKRLNLFLMWMIRSDDVGVHFGLWKNIPKSALMLPLDIHTATLSRQLGILKRNQNDWLAVEEVTSFLRRLDPEDPVKYDFALFGLDLDKKLNKISG